MQINYIKFLKSATIVALCMVVVSCSESSKKEIQTGNGSIEDTATVATVATTVVNDGDTIAAEQEPNTKPLTLAFVGDIMMGTTYPKHEKNLPSDDGESLFKDTKEILRRVDIAAGNLEGSLYDGDGVPKKCYNPATCFTFKMPERYSKHLIDAGFDFVGIANNHINDFGPDALEGTQRVLNESGLAYAGVSGKKPTAIIEQNGQKVGFAAFGFNQGMPSVNNFEEIKTIVSELKNECDFVVISFHGGGEGKNFQHVPHKKEITSSDRGDVEKFAHAAIDAGADAVYGHSPHVPRAVELYKDRIIFYSLGNFCTPFRFNLAGVNGLAPLAEVTLNPDGSFAEGQIHSFTQTRGVGPRKDSSNQAAKKMRELTKVDFPSTPLEISNTGKITRKAN